MDVFHALQVQSNLQSYKRMLRSCQKSRATATTEESAVGLALDANVIDKPTSRRGLHSFFSGHVESENLQFCYSQPQSAHCRVTTVWLEFQSPLITD